MRREFYQIACGILLVVVLILVGILLYNGYNADTPIWKNFMAPDTTRVDTAHIQPRTPAR